MPANQDVNINLVANNAQAKAAIAETEAQVKKLGNTANEGMNFAKNPTLRGLSRLREALYRIAIPVGIALGVTRIVKGFEDAREAVVNFQREGIDAANSLTAAFSKFGRQSTGGIADQFRDLGEQQAEALQKISDEKNKSLAEVERRSFFEKRQADMGLLPSAKDIEDRARRETEGVLRGVAQAKKNLAQLEKEQNVQLQQEIDTARGAEKTKAEQIEIERVNRHQERLLQIDKASQHKSNAFRKQQLEELDRIEQENFKKRRDREMQNQYERTRQQIRELRDLQAIELEQNMQLQREIDSERASEGTKAEQIEAERKSRHQERLLEIEKASQHKSNAFRKRMLEDLDKVEQENFKKRRDREMQNQYERTRQQIQELRDDLFARHGLDSLDQGALSGEQMMEFMNLVIPSIIRRNGGR